MIALYDLIKEVQCGYNKENQVITVFEPKIKTSLRYTNLENREDLEQELKIRVLHYSRSYRLEDIPGLFEMSGPNEGRDSG